MLTALLRAGVPENVAVAIANAYVANREPASSYLARLGIAALNVAEDLGGKTTLDVLYERACGRAS